MGHRLLRLRGCERCGVEFQPTNRKVQQRFCSVSCSQTKKTDTERVVEAEVKALRRIARMVQRLPSRPGFQWRVRASRPCRDCGGEVGAKATKVYSRSLCLACSGLRALVSKRKARKARKALEKRVRVVYFDPIEVLARDGWVCYLCGESTPSSLRGTYDPRAPELDHIVPLSKGGEHSPENTACACRACNLAKSDTTLSPQEEKTYIDQGVRQMLKT